MIAPVSHLMTARSEEGAYTMRPTKWLSVSLAVDGFEDVEAVGLFRSCLSEGEAITFIEFAYLGFTNLSIAPKVGGP